MICHFGFSALGRQVGTTGIDQKGAGKEAAPEQHAVNHLTPGGQAELRLLDYFADADPGADAVTFLNNPVGRADPGVAHPFGRHSLSTRPTAPVENHFKLEAVIGELNDPAHIKRTTTRSGIRLGGDMTDAPVRKTDRFFPANGMWLRGDSFAP